MNTIIKQANSRLPKGSVPIPNIDTLMGQGRQPQQPQRNDLAAAILAEKQRRGL